MTDTTSTSAPPATKASAQTPQRIVELDAIRGIAILLVIIFHYFISQTETDPGTLGALLKRIFSVSWAGVDLFFVLSGFLIGGILIKQREAENYFSAFYMRRAARLFPLYMLSIALYAILSPWMLASGTDAGKWLVTGNGETALPLWGYVLYLQNILMAKSVTWGGHWLAPTWSLAVEEQFYLVAPLLLRVVPLRRLPSVLFVLMGAGMICRALMFATSGHWLPGYVLLVTRWDALFIGILAAYALADARWKTKLEDHSHRLPLMLSVLMAGLGVMVVFGVDKDSATMAMFGFTYLALTSLVAVYVALFVKNRWTALIFRNAGLARLGMISYGVYILHQPVIGLICVAIHGYQPGIVGPANIVVAILAVVITIGLAEVSWRFFEKPILDFGHRFAYRRIRPAIA